MAARTRRSGEERPVGAVEGAGATVATTRPRFGAVLKRFQLVAGLTQEQLAERAALSAVPAGTLPARLTSFVGRTREGIDAPRYQ